MGCLSAQAQDPSLDRCHTFHEKPIWSHARDLLRLAQNVLHHAGINECILDITATLKPHFTIVDGIVGMEGDGPIMGSPVQANVLVMGRNLPAVDATCARLMGINPHKIGYLALASNWLGPIHEKTIQQVGESIASQQRNFLLLEKIPAHRRIRLT